jgi:hypothetical protein
MWKEVKFRDMLHRKQYQDIPELTNQFYIVFRLKVITDYNAQLIYLA